MNIIVNTASTFKGGSVQVAVSFINECKGFKGHEFHVILSKSVLELIELSSFPENFSFHPISFRPATKVLTLSDQSDFFKKLEREFNPDVVFTTSGPAYWRPKCPHLMGFNLAHHLYPESPFFKLLSFRARMKWRIKSQFIKYYTVADADAYVTQTDDINNRLRLWTGKQRVYTVANTYGAHYDMPTTSVENRLTLRKGQEKRFLILSAYYKHKNLELINEIVGLWTAREKRDFRFVVTLPEDVFNRIFTSETRPYIINAGPVKPVDCPALYKECDFAFIPTLLECFSAAYPEAMKMGKPILTTDLGFAHAICGEAALFYKPMDPVDALHKMRYLASDSSIQEALRHQGFKRLSSFISAKNRAKRYLEICEEIAE